MLGTDFSVWSLQFISMNMRFCQLIRVLAIKRKKLKKKKKRELESIILYKTIPLGFQLKSELLMAVRIYIIVKLRRGLK